MPSRQNAIREIKTSFVAVDATCGLHRCHMLTIYLSEEGKESIRNLGSIEVVDSPTENVSALRNKLRRG